MDFHEAIKFVLKWEGEGCYQVAGESWMTCYGISQRANPDLSFPLSKEQAIDVYHGRYWLKAGCEELPTPMNLVVFDTAVNMGILTSRKLLTQAGNDPVKYLGLRLGEYASMEGLFSKYGRGWTRRVADLLHTITPLLESKTDRLDSARRFFLVVWGQKGFELPFAKASVVGDKLYVRMFSSDPR